MKKRKLISMLRLLVIPVALAIGSGTASAQNVTVLGNSKSFTVIGNSYAGAATNAKWTKSGTVWQLTNSDTYNGCACTVKDSWMQAGNFSLTAGQVYTFEYTVPSGFEDAKNGIEVYLSKDGNRKLMSRLCEKGESTVNFTVNSSTTYYLVIRGCKGSGYATIKFSGGTLVANNASDVEGVKNLTTFSTDNYPKDGSVFSNDVYGKWYIVEQYTVKLDNYAWGPSATSGRMFLNTYTNSSAAGSNDWLITNEGYELTKGKTYRVSFNIKNGNNTLAQTEQIGVYVAQSKDLESIKAGKLIWDYAYPGGTDGSANVADLDNDTFTPDSDGKYYFGIWSHNSKTRTSVEIWDFNVEEVASGEGPITYTLGETTEFPFEGASLKENDVTVNGMTMNVTGASPEIEDGKLNLPAGGSICLNAPSGYYFERITLKGISAMTGESFTVSAPGSCIADGNNFSWTTDNGFEEVVTFTSNLSDVIVISQIDVVFNDPATFVAKPDENNWYSSTLAVMKSGNPVFHKGWTALGNSTWNAVSAGKVESDGSKDAEGDLLCSPKILLKAGKEYVVKMDAKAKSDSYSYVIYVVTDVADVATSEPAITTEAGGSSSIVTFDAIFSPETDGIYYFIVKPVRAGVSGTGVTLSHFAVNELLNPSANIYKFNHEDGYGKSVLARADATIFDFSDYPGKLSQLAPANRNAYVIGTSDVTLATYKGIKLMKNGDDSYSATNGVYINGNRTIDGEGVETYYPFNFHYDVTVPGTSDITFTRDLNTQYLTVVLPFQLWVNDSGHVHTGVADNTLYGFTGMTEDGCLNFSPITDSEGVPAYTPVMVSKDNSSMYLYLKGVSAKGIMSIENSGYTPISKSNGNIYTKVVDEKNGWSQAFSTEKFVLTATEIENMGGVYFLKDGKFWKAGTDLTVIPFRVFYVKEKSVSMPAPSYNFKINGDVPTGLESLFEDELRGNEGPAYNEAGVRVSDNYKGIKIRNGKKVIENR